MPELSRNLKFEPVDRGNAASVAQLAREIWTEHYSSIIGRGQVDYMLGRFQSEETIVRQISEEGMSYYLLRGETGLLGYVAFRIRGAELFLDKFYILSAARGRGYGKEALEFIEKEGRKGGAAKITLTVNRMNRVAIAAYTKMGFRNIGTVVKDIGGGFVMDDFAMEKNMGEDRISDIQ